MNTGLPGTGIGGLFYMISVMVMIILEIRDILMGKKNGKSKEIVIEQTIIIVLLGIAIHVTNVFFSKYVFKKPPVFLAVNASFNERISYLIINYPILVPFTLLVMVLIFTQTMYLFLKNRK